LGDPQATVEVLLFTTSPWDWCSLVLVMRRFHNLSYFFVMKHSEAELAEPIIILLPVALGLLYLRKQESVEATGEVAKTFDEKIRKYLM